jgi:hypothetical protein
VVVSQLKINVTNAYAGSLAWSNFFARLTHRPPGARRVGCVQHDDRADADGARCVPRARRGVLGLFTNIATLVDHGRGGRPGGSTSRSAGRRQGIEFKRAHLYDINPVGVGAMGLASVLSMLAYLGWSGRWRRPSRR